jgi:hypothetical protein
VEQNLRSARFYKVVYDANVLSDNVPVKELIALRGTTTESEYAVVSRNQLNARNSMAVTIGQSNSGSCDTEVLTGIQYIWLTENTVDIEADAPNIGFQIQVCGSSGSPGWTDDIVVMLNIINWSNSFHTASFQFGGVIDQIGSGGFGTKDGHKVLHNIMVWNGSNTVTLAQTVVDFESATRALCVNNAASLKASGTVTFCDAGVTSTTNHEDSSATPADLWGGTAGYPTAYPIDADDYKITAGDALDSAGTALTEPPVVLDIFRNACPNGSMEIGVHCIAD